MLSSQRSLKERILKGSSVLSQSIYNNASNPFLLSCPSRPSKYKPWCDSALQETVSAVQQQKLSIRRAAVQYNVPRSTLHDHLSGKAPFGSISRPEHYLTDQEESELVNFLCGCAAVGFAKSRQQVLSLVEQVIRKKGKPVSLSPGWWQSFKKRHPTLTLRSAAPLSYARAVCSSPEILSQYYDLLEKTLVGNDLDGKLKFLTWMKLGFPWTHAPPPLSLLQLVQNMFHRLPLETKPK